MTAKEGDQMPDGSAHPSFPESEEIDLPCTCGSGNPYFLCHGARYDEVDNQLDSEPPSGTTDLQVNPEENSRF